MFRLFSQYFLAPFASTHFLRLKKYLTEKLASGFEAFKRSATKLHMFIDIQGPVFLLPQRKEIPSLLVLNTGVLSMENFFKKIDQSTQSVKTSGDSNQITIDNILIKLNNVTVSRAIMTLSRDLEIQVRFNIKFR